MALSPSRPIRTPLPGVRGVTTVGEQQRYARRHLVLWYLGALGFAGLVCAALLLFGPSPSAIAWTILLTALAIALYNPRYGLYALLFLTMVGDGVLTPWYPFLKNFSSIESLLYVHDALIVNPGEVLIMTIIASWLVRVTVTRSFTLFLGYLFLPALAFLVFVTLGFFYGISQGGDLTIALWEARGMFYMPLAMVIASNLIQSRDHVRQLMWCAMVGLAIDGALGFVFVANDLRWDIGSVLEIAEHPFSIHLNSMFVLLLALVFFNGSPRMRWFLLMALPFMLVAYVANQRRAAYVAFVVVLLLLGLLSQWFNRKLFWSIFPPLALVFVVYLGIFWNSNAAPAAVAKQVRSIVAPVEGSEESSSNLYRRLENINIHHTINQAPLTGVGFGRKFLIIAPMADISFFIWWEYFTHNSVLWVWMKAGFGGFVALLMLIGSAVALGMRNVLRAPPGDMRAIAFMSVGYVVMHFTFAYVDISWGGESMIYLGTLLGLINGLERMIATPVPIKSRRWPWQREPEPAPGLQSI